MLVDHINKVDYYRTRNDLDACFHSGLLNRDHIHYCESDATSWKLDRSGMGFIEAQLPESGKKDYVWPLTASVQPTHTLLDLELMPDAIKQFRWKMNSGYPIRVAVTNVGDDGRRTDVKHSLYTFKTEEMFNTWRESDHFDPNGYYTIWGVDKVLAYDEGAVSNYFVNAGTHPRNLYPGDKLFHLKTTRGIPLEISLENLTRRSMTVEWEGFIKEARLSGWYDFQTVEAIKNAVEDVFDRNDQEEIMQRVKYFILSRSFSRVRADELLEILKRANITYVTFRASYRPEDDRCWDRDEIANVILAIKSTPVTRLL